MCACKPLCAILTIDCDNQGAAWHPICPQGWWPMVVTGTFLPSRFRRLRRLGAGPRLDRVHGRQMNEGFLHIVFDVAAWAAAGLSFLWLNRHPEVRFPPTRSRELAYVAALLFGAGVGAFVFGTATLRLGRGHALAVGASRARALD